MSVVFTQIKTAYEEEGMSPEEISEDQSLELSSVKAALMQSSSKYRKDCGHECEDEDDLNFSKDQLREVNKVIFELAVSAEDEHTRAKMATYIRDDKKGRKDIVRQVANNTFNILQFNEQLQLARQAVKRLSNKAIEA